MAVKVTVTFDYSKLLARIIEMKFTRSTFAKALGITRQHLGKILNEGLPISSAMIYRMAQILEIDDELTPYFFTLKVQKI